MMRYARFGVLVLLAMTASVQPAHAQSWEMPSFFSPRPGEDLGVYAFQQRDGDTGFEGIWRQEGNLNLGVRLGILGGSNDIFVGSEFYKPISIGGAGSSILMSGVLGLGATFGDGVTSLRVPLGVSIGTQLGSGSIQLLPYVHPRVAFDLFASDEVAGESDTETEVNFELDVGADIGLGSQFVGRVGATLTHDSRFNAGTVLGVGIAYRMPRRVVVR